MRYYLIDYENVSSEGLRILTDVKPEDRVIIFYSDQRKNISFDMLENLERMGVKPELIKVNIGTKNALDFQLVSYLGYLIGLSRGKTRPLLKFFSGSEGPAPEYIIVSKDKGFDCPCEYWRANGEIVVRKAYEEPKKTDAASQEGRGRFGRQDRGPRSGRNSADRDRTENDGKRRQKPQLQIEKPAAKPAPAKSSVPEIKEAAPAEKPAAKPVQAEKKTPAEKPAAKSAPAEKPAVKPAQAEKQTPAEKPAGKPAPAEKSDEKVTPEISEIKENPAQAPKAAPAAKETAPASKKGHVESADKATMEELMAYIAPEDEPEKVLEIVNRYKTKNAICNAIQKEFKDANRTGDVYRKLRPLLKEKRKS